jgi:isopenicillin N synthase-like dioxygenase
MDGERRQEDGRLAPPVIDIGALREAAAARDPARASSVVAAMRLACTGTGFFYIANHGVAPASVERIFAESKRFFAQPTALKERIAITANRGYEGIGRQALNEATGADVKESVMIGDDAISSDHPAVRAGLPMHAANQWPAELPGWRASVLDYFATMDRLTKLLLSGLALSLALPWDFFEGQFEPSMSSLRMLHYPPHPTADPAREVGCGAHTDWGLLTVLAQDTVGGLEIQLPSGEWVGARPIEGAFIVNIGDMMARWSNDLYKSTPHRVLNRSLHDRYSIAFFGDPAYHTRVECLPSCAGPDRPPRYAPTTSGEHLAEMYRKTYGAAA